MVNDLFLHEYLGRPENRVNVALFSMLQQSWFREWFLQSLGLPLDSIAYPPSNRNDCRPDLKVVDPARLNGAAVAWIEVELSKNTGQIKDYGEKLHPDPIRRLWGKRSHGGDLSLEEVAEFLNEQTGLDPQTTVNVQQLVELIREGLEGHSSSPGRSALTEEMRSHPLVTALGNHLGSLIHPLILLSNDTKDSLEYPLLHKHLQKPLHQWTDSLIRPVGNMVIQHQPLTKQRVRTIFHRVRL